MRYYKGNCLEQEVLRESLVQEKNPVRYFRFWRYICFPFMLLVWIFQLVIHKSMEVDDVN
ncbi:MAG: hypothetical protein QE487_13660 [Fluviicola sp.]|nr:hypothetical protein [Fluviicola sp.]